jgi:hypothetical protein
MLKAKSIRNRSIQRHSRRSGRAVSDPVDDRERGKFSSLIQSRVDPRSGTFVLGPSLLPTLPPIADTRRPRVSGEKVPRLAPYTRQQVPLWAGYAIPFLAGRAFWLGQNETCFSVRASGDVVMGHQELKLRDRWQIVRGEQLTVGSV